MTVVPVSASTGLSITAEQEWWTPKQQAALDQIGIGAAPDGDKLVFLHVARRTGLDPFARQIHMVSRNTKDQRTNQWVTKWTIQTGIDGYRLIADRADKRDGTLREYADTEWCDDQGVWHDVWTSLKPPTAARVIVFRNGRKFPGVAMYREYVQTKRDGEPNSMWSRMPGNQLAKCAEALALRKAYPQDLSGIYTDDEMGQADREQRTVTDQPGASAGDRMAAMLADSSPAPDSPESEPVAPPATRSADEGDGNDEASAGEDSPPLNTRSALAKRMFAVLNDAGLGGKSDAEKAARLAEVSAIIGRTVDSSSDMTEDDARAVVATLEVREAIDAEVAEDGA